MSKQREYSFYDSSDFRSIVRNHVSTRPRGEYRKIAIKLQMHTTLLSQIMAGVRCLTTEQAASLAEYLKLNNSESEYFVLLIQKERAGTSSLRLIFERQLSQLRKQAKDIKSRVPESLVMSEVDRQTYYLDWHYSLIRIATDIKELQTVDKISERFSIPIEKVHDIINFLVSKNLCTQIKDRTYKRTSQNTHVEASSPLARRHHLNWRTQALRLLDSMSENNLAFTAPISISTKDKEVVREILIETISKISKIVSESEPEDLVYLGIDWLEI